MHAFAKPDPVQELFDLGAIGGLLLAAHAERQRHILIGRHVIEQAEILENDADPAAQQRHFLGRDRRDILAEHGDQAARRFQRHEQQAQQRSLAGARRAGQELERPRCNVEADITQNLRAHPIAQTDILKTNQA